MFRVVLFLCICLFGVWIFPESLQNTLFSIPVNGWTIVHLLSTRVFVEMNPNLTQVNYWMVVTFWEILENGIGFFYNNYFLESAGDILGDILIAYPASLCVNYA